jgi:hypothetical protein
VIPFLCHFEPRRAKALVECCVYARRSLVEAFCASFALPLLLAHVLPGKVLFTSRCGSSPSSLSRLSLSSFYAPRLLFSIGLSTQLDAQNVLCCVHGRESSPRSLAHTQRKLAAARHPPTPASIKSAGRDGILGAAHALAECKRDAL